MDRPLQFLPKGLVDKLLSLDRPLALKHFGNDFDGNVGPVGIVVGTHDFDLVRAEGLFDFGRAHVDDRRIGLCGSAAAAQVTGSKPAGWVLLPYSRSRSIRSRSRSSSGSGSGKGSHDDTRFKKFGRGGKH